MKRKLWLPVMAFVFAIGLSFTTERSTADPDEDYYLEAGQFVSFDMEVPCGPPQTFCTAQITEGGPVHDVYDSRDLNSRKNGSATAIKLWELQD